MLDVADVEDTSPKYSKIREATAVSVRGAEAEL